MPIRSHWYSSSGSGAMPPASRYALQLGSGGLSQVLAPFDITIGAALSSPCTPQTAISSGVSSSCHGCGAPAAGTPVAGRVCGPISSQCSSR